MWGALTGLLSQSQDSAASGGRVASQADGLYQLNLAMKAACVGELKVCVRKCCLSKVSAFVLLKFSTVHAFLWSRILPERTSQNHCDIFNTQMNRILLLAKEPLLLWRALHFVVYSPVIYLKYSLTRVCQCQAESGRESGTAQQGSQPFTQYLLICSPFWLPSPKPCPENHFPEKG